MHPALKKGPLFYKRNLFSTFFYKKHPHFPRFYKKHPHFPLFYKTPPFSHFYKKHPLISFPAYRPGSTVHNAGRKPTAGADTGSRMN